MDIVEWVLISGSKLVKYDDFEEDLYQESDYAIFTLPIDWEEETVWTYLSLKGHLK